MGSEYGHVKASHLCDALEDHSTYAGGEGSVWVLQLKDDVLVTDAVSDGGGGVDPLFPGHDWAQAFVTALIEMDGVAFPI